MEMCSSTMSTRVKQRAVIKFLTAEKVTPTEIHRPLKAVYSENTVDRSTVNLWGGLNISYGSEFLVRLLSFLFLGKKHSGERSKYPRDPIPLTQVFLGYLFAEGEDGKREVEEKQGHSSSRGKATSWKAQL
ncbi:hypothetical protein J437_LFUL007241 [Ladona fulva]|uniref:Uncharacterized protein n=1 Tax=Ladona fulva TaxID=123851 RepID=A0A8K0NWA2_LADFU|nr:hypothetical protein J437_LFUL007241 [Ladona fulva]